jgi:hypothetical protein
MKASGNGFPAPESKNHGSSDSKMARGQSIREAWGKDASACTGSMSAERGKDLAGGVNNLSHSLKGSSAQQHAD